MILLFSKDRVCQLFRQFARAFYISTFYVFFCTLPTFAFFYMFAFWVCILITCRVAYLIPVFCNFFNTHCSVSFLKTARLHSWSRSSPLWLQRENRNTAPRKALLYYVRRLCPILGAALRSGFSSGLPAASLLGAGLPVTASLRSFLGCRFCMYNCWSHVSRFFHLFM